MNREQIQKFLDSFSDKKDRTLVIVDFGNVEKWKHGLGWEIDIHKLAQLIKRMSQGKQSLRRFYYGSDFGSLESSVFITEWSRMILEKARNYGFEIVTKRVKYMHSSGLNNMFVKKCDLDVEMAVDIIKQRDEYDSIILFSGDGDLMYAVKYVCEIYQKKCFVFGVRGHVGREVYDANKIGIVQDILYAGDMEYRLRR